jgi:fucose permease
LQQPAWTGAGLALSATTAGFIKLPSTGAGSLASLVTGWLVGRTGPWFCMLLGSALSAVAAFCAIFLHSSVISVFTLVLLVSVGITTVYTTVPILISAGTPLARTSEAMGVMAVMRAVFQGVGAQIVAVILASDAVIGPKGVRFPTDASYVRVFAYIGATALLIMAIALIRRAPGLPSGGPVALSTEAARS